MKEHKTKTILVVAGFQPFPTLFGGAVDVWERVKGLKALGYHIDLVYTEKQPPTKTDEQQMLQTVDHLYYVARKNKVTDLFFSKPLQALSRKKLKKIQLKKTYDFVLLEGEFVGEILNNKTLKYKHLIIRVHNNEYAYFKELKKSASSLIKKSYYQCELPKIKKYSKKIIAKANHLWYISDDERRESSFLKKSIFLPPPINDTYVAYTQKDQPIVLFIGALFMPNNIFAIDWYLKNIHPHFLENPAYTFLIVGGCKTQKQQKELEKKYSTYKKVKLYFNQKDLSKFYAQAKVFINPMFHGSGVKIKTIEALRNGLPLVTTRVGAEGMNFNDKHLWLANTATDFKESIEQIFTENSENLAKKVNAAQQHLQEYHYLKIMQNELKKYEGNH